MAFIRSPTQFFCHFTVNTNTRKYARITSTAITSTIVSGILQLNDALATASSRCNAYAVEASLALE